MSGSFFSVNNNTSASSNFYIHGSWYETHGQLNIQLVFDCFDREFWIISSQINVLLWVYFNLYALNKVIKLNSLVRFRLRKIDI